MTGQGARIIAMPTQIRNLQVMTIGEASMVLRKPVFGDERCIEARNLLELAAEVTDARRLAARHDLDLRSVAHLDRMTADDCREELSEWNFIGLFEEVQL